MPKASNLNQPTKDALRGAVGMHRIDVRRYGTKGDGINDDAPAIRAAIAANPGAPIELPKPAVCYLLGSSLGNIPAGTRLIGQGRMQTCLKRGFSGGYVMSVQDGAQLENLTIDGNGENFTGGGIDVPVGHGNQTAENVRVLAVNGAPCVHFAATGLGQYGGSQSRWKGCHLYRIDATAGSGNYCIEHDDPGVVVGGHPIYFHDLQTGGSMSFSAGACDNFTVTDSVIFEFATSDTSRAVRINGGRISSPSDPIVLRGTGSIVGTFVSPKLTIAAAPVPAWTIVPGTLNNGFEDLSSPTQSIVVDQAVYDYAPVITFGGVPVTAGDGEVVGSYRRNGVEVCGEVSFVIGQTTVIPEGVCRISAPTAPAHASLQYLIEGRLYSAATSAPYRLFGLIEFGETGIVIEAVNPLAGNRLTPVSNSFPSALPAGSEIRLSFRYSL